LGGSNTVFSDDIVDNQVYSADVRNDTLSGGGLATADIRPSSVGTSEVTNESLTGQDIKNHSGVDTCVAATVRLGQLCVRGENQTRDWFSAAQYCASLDLRLPSFAEALELATTHDIPNVDPSEYFWTGSRYVSSDGFFYADIVNDDATIANSEVSFSRETVCVTTPTN
jgi:hypothetical protein